MLDSFDQGLIYDGSCMRVLLYTNLGSYLLLTGCMRDGVYVGDGDTMQHGCLLEGSPHGLIKRSNGREQAQFLERLVKPLPVNRRSRA